MEPSPTQLSTDRVFLDFSARKLEQLTGRIRECVKRLNDEQIWTRSSDNENAVGNLMLHLAGNVRQWIIASVGGKPDVRVRDREFSARGDITAAELIDRLEGTVAEAVAVHPSLLVTVTVYVPCERLLMSSVIAPVDLA